MDSVFLVACPINSQTPNMAPPRYPAEKTKKATDPPPGKRNDSLCFCVAFLENDQKRWSPNQKRKGQTQSHSHSHVFFAPSPGFGAPIDRWRQRSSVSSAAWRRAPWMATTWRSSPAALLARAKASRCPGPGGPDMAQAVGRREGRKGGVRVVGGSMFCFLDLEVGSLCVPCLLLILSLVKRKTKRVSVFFRIRSPHVDSGVPFGFPLRPSKKGYKLKQRHTHIEPSSPQLVD